MHYLFSENLTITSTEVLLPEDEHRHAKVLRIIEGETIGLLNGAGLIAHSLLRSDRKNTVAIVSEVISHPLPSPHIHLKVGLLKSREFLELILEKSTELGVASITLLHTENTERSYLSLDRLHRVLISAVKQSGNPWLPILAVKSFDEAIAESANHLAERFIAHCYPSQKTSLTKPQGESVEIWIGPEGDFTMAEVNQAIDKGFKPVSLGNLRLRTETAAIAAISLLRLS